MDGIIGTTCSKKEMRERAKNKGTERGEDIYIR